MHFSRSPFMDFAVTAMIGRSEPRSSLRISLMVVMPSISGIMMSISTMSMCASRRTMSIASRPLLAETTSMPSSSSTVASAKMLRMSSSTSSARFLSSTRCELCSSSSEWRSSSDIDAVLRWTKK